MDLNSRSTVNHESTWTKFAWGKAALLVFLLLLLANVLFLDFVVLTKKGGELKFAITGDEEMPKLETAILDRSKFWFGDLGSEQGDDSGSEIITDTPGVSSEVKAEIDFCPAACFAVISEATASALAQITPMPTSTPISITSVPVTKELYIPLGGGSTSSKTWTELPGIEAVIDMDNYPNVKSIIFEASMRIPTANGKVYAKLYNVTDKHDAWYSEVDAEGSSSYRAESGNVILSSGRKLYRVMMKSTMGYEAILDSARIKILLE